jgi:Ca2+-binding RTX toxin-like protein
MMRLLLLSLLCLASGCHGGVGSSSSSEAAPRSGIRFTDVTAAAGISFQHVNGAEGKKYMPETMGSGCAFIDYNNDGWQELLFVNGEPWSDVQARGSRAVAARPGTHAVGDGGTRAAGPGAGPRGRSGRRPHTRSPAPTMALYRNDGTGRFHEVTVAVGLDVPMYGMGAAVGDWDNDGFDDLAITALGGVYLFHNEEGRRFRLVSSALLAGTAASSSTHPLPASRAGELSTRFAGTRPLRGYRSGPLCHVPYSSSVRRNL